MRKVTKRLLTVGVAVFALACQDSITIVDPPDPPPPPPPPPPPAVDATVSILGLDLIPGPGSVNPTAIMGDINVSLNVEEGDNTVTGIDLLFDGVAIGCQQINTNTVPGQGGQVSFSSTGGADVVECFWDTDDVQGACTGSNLPPAFSNGTHTLGAQITLSDNTTRTADQTQEVTLVNGDFVMLTAVTDQAATIGANGRAYSGGPSTLMDGSANAVAIAACPVSYNGTTVASLGIGGYTTLGTTNVDFGSGAATVHQDASEPFVFTIDPTTNGALEDDPTGAGHFFGDTGTTFICTGNFGTNCTGQVFDDAGLNVTTQFTYGSIFDMHLDFMGPTIAAGATIQIDGVDVISMLAAPQPVQPPHYSSGTFNLSASVTDLGVGLGSGANIVFNVNDCDQTAGTDCGLPPPAGVNTQIVAMSTGIADLAEDDHLDNDDVNGLDTYEVDVTKVADALENNATAAQLANIVNNPAGSIGVDTGAPVISTLVPVTDPTDNPFLVLNDVSLMFDVADPVLASGDAGSGLDITGCTGAIGGLTGCTNVTATDGGATYEVDGPPTGVGVSIDIADVGGLGSAGPMADGEQTVTLTAKDIAVLTANASTDDWTFILDTTGPDIKPFTAFESDATLSGSAAVFNLAGQVVDGDGVPNSGEGSTIATLSVGIFTDAGATCAAVDVTALAQGSGAGQVDDQSRSIGAADADFTTNTTEDHSFASAFLVQNPGAGTTVSYCMIVDSTDSAVNKLLAAAANVGRSFNRFTITWQ